MGGRGSRKWGSAQRREESLGRGKRPAMKNIAKGHQHRPTTKNTARGHDHQLRGSAGCQNLEAICGFNKGSFPAVLGTETRLE